MIGGDKKYFSGENHAIIPPLALSFLRVLCALCGKLLLHSILASFGRRNR